MAKKPVQIKLKYIRSSKNYHVYEGAKPLFPSPNQHIAKDALGQDAPAVIIITITEGKA